LEGGELGVHPRSSRIVGSDDGLADGEGALQVLAGSVGISGLVVDLAEAEEGHGHAEVLGPQ
jgi:hypothetical protein